MDYIFHSSLSWARLVMTDIAEFPLPSYDHEQNISSPNITNTIVPRLHFNNQRDTEDIQTIPEKCTRTIMWYIKRHDSYRRYRNSFFFSLPQCHKKRLAGKKK